MIKRIISICLSLTFCSVFLCCTAFASTSRASLTLSAYDVGINTGDDTTEVLIDYDVRAAGLASSVGVETINIYRTNGVLVASITGTVSNGLVRNNYVMHKGTYTCNLTSGVAYYAEVTIFARVGSNYDSRTITTSTIIAP